MVPDELVQRWIGLCKEAEGGAATLAVLEACDVSDLPGLTYGLTETERDAVVGHLVSEAGGAILLEELPKAKRLAAWLDMVGELHRAATVPVHVNLLLAFVAHEEFDFVTVQNHLTLALNHAEAIGEAELSALCVDSEATVAWQLSRLVDIPRGVAQGTIPESEVAAEAVEALGRVERVLFDQGLPGTPRTRLEAKTAFAVAMTFLDLEMFERATALASAVDRVWLEEPDSSLLLRLAEACLGRAEPQVSLDVIAALHQITEPFTGSIAVRAIALSEVDPTRAVPELKRALAADPDNGELIVRLAGLTGDEMVDPGHQRMTALIPETVLLVAVDDGTVYVDPALAPAEYVSHVVGALVVDTASTQSLAELERTDPGAASESRRLLGGLPVELRNGKAQEAFFRAEDSFARGEFVQAAEAYQAAIDVDPYFALAYLFLGNCWFRLGDYELASVYFQESLEVFETPMGWRFFGDALRNLGEPNTVVRNAYERALVLDPGYGGAINSLNALKERDRSPPSRVLEPLWKRLGDRSE